MPLLAASPQVPAAFSFVACLLVGLGCFVLVRWLIGVFTTEDVQQGNEWRYDISRINELRRADLWYRIFQPILQLGARLNRALFRDTLPEIQREIQAAGLTRFWLAEEYLARAELWRCS